MDLVYVRGAYVPRMTAGNRTPVFPPLPVYDANRINGTPVNDAGKADGRALTYDATTHEIVWGSGGSGSGAVLTVANNGETLGTTHDTYFVTIGYYGSFSVTLPAPAAMPYRRLSFTTTTEVYEAWFSVAGPINGGDTTFQLAGTSTLTLVSDGADSWWIASYYN